MAGLHEKFVGAHADFTVVATAHSGPGALDSIAEHAPDLVLLDFYLPGRSGLEVLRDVRARPGRQPEVIAVTAARDVDSVRQARSLGVRHYLVKPFSAAELRARLDDIVRDRRLISPGGGSLGQSDIDSIMTSAVLRQTVLPKGLSRETLASVILALAEAPDASASEIGDIVGVSRVSSRRCLEHLVDTERAVRTLDYQTTGRPSSRYRLAAPTD